MMNGPFVYDSAEFKAGEGRVVVKAPKSYTDEPFIIFEGRKSIFGKKKFIFYEPPPSDI